MLDSRRHCRRRLADGVRSRRSVGGVGPIRERVNVKHRVSQGLHHDTDDNNTNQVHQEAGLDLVRQKSTITF